MWGSVMDHELAVVKLEHPSRKLCCWCARGEKRRPRVTRHGQANGITMTSGCEWHVRKWFRDTLRMRRARYSRPERTP